MNLLRKKVLIGKNEKVNLLCDSSIYRDFHQKYYFQPLYSIHDDNYLQGNLYFALKLQFKDLWMQQRSKQDEKQPFYVRDCTEITNLNHAKKYKFSSLTKLTTILLGFIGSSDFINFLQHQHSSSKFSLLPACYTTINFFM